MGGGKGGGGDVEVDLNKVFPGLITPSFSLLPRSAAPATTGGMSPEQFAAMSNQLFGPGLPGQRRSFGQQGQGLRGPFFANTGVPVVSPGAPAPALQGTVSEETVLSPTGLRIPERLQDIASLPREERIRAIAARRRGRGGRRDIFDAVGSVREQLSVGELAERGAFGGATPRSTGGGGGGEFVLSRTGPDPFLDELRTRALLGENTAALQALGTSLGRQGQALEEQFGRIDRLGRNSLAAQFRLAGLSRASRAQRGNLYNLLDDVEPGFGRLMRTQVRALQQREAREQGNLRESLRSRRVLGSSFGIREQQRLERDFGQEEERLRAQTFLQEMGARQSIIGQVGQFLGLEAGIEGQQADFLRLDQQSINQRSAVIAQQMGLNAQQQSLLSDQFRNIQADFQLVQARVSRELEELRISGNLVNQASSAATQLAGLEAQAAAAEAGGFGEFLGGLIGLIPGLPFFGGS